MTQKKKPKISTRKKKRPSGNSVAARNRALRRECLREQLQGAAYIRELTKIAERLDPGARNAYTREQVPQVKARIDVLTKLLDKALPNARDMPVKLPAVEGELHEKSGAVLDALVRGELTPSEAKETLAAMTAHTSIVDSVELAERLKRLEGRVARREGAAP